MKEESWSVKERLWRRKAELDRRNRVVRGKKAILDVGRGKKKGRKFAWGQ